MTVKELKELLADVPDDTSVTVEVDVVNNRKRSLLVDYRPKAVYYPDLSNLAFEGEFDL